MLTLDDRKHLAMMLERVSPWEIVMAMADSKSSAYYRTDISWLRDTFSLQGQELAKHARQLRQFWLEQF